MNQRYDVLGFGLVILAVALFALMSITIDEPSWLLRWQPLIGSLIGASGTIGAGWLAFRRQTAHSEQQALKSQSAAKLAAILAL